MNSAKIKTKSEYCSTGGKIQHETQRQLILRN